MPRDLSLSNGRFAVNFDHRYRLRDIYYPRVGEDNHGGHPQRLGVWVDGHLSWVGDADWRVEMRYADSASVTSVVLRNETRALTLRFSDTVDESLDLLIRRIQIENHADRAREVRLFVGTFLHIRESDWANTAYYDPKLDAVVHYKRDLWFAVGGSGAQGKLDGYTTGRSDPRGEWGSWQDAWDGHLDGSPITQGTVDSCIQLTFALDANGRAEGFTWLAAGHDRESLRRTVRSMREVGPREVLERTRRSHQEWLAKANPLPDSFSDRWKALYARSLLLVRTQVDSGGAILAGTDSDILQFGRDTYAYLWPRDGALVAYALGRAGYFDKAQRYFRFCAKLVAPEGWFFHKYTPSGLPGSSWHPWVHEGSEQLAVQEDETALMVWALWKHWEMSGDDALVQELYDPLVRRPAEWMLEFRRRSLLPASSYDLWEERRGIHAFTVGSVIGAFDGAAVLARRFGDAADAVRYEQAAADMRSAAAEHLFRTDWNRFARMLQKPDAEGDYVADPVVDSALYGLLAFGAFPTDDPRMRSTMEAVEKALYVHTPVGGYARYFDDYYQQASRDLDRVPGNPWIISTLWVAQWFLAAGEPDRATRLLDWVADRALPSGVLAEQIHPYTGEPMSVSPLTWSHATFVLAVLDYAASVERTAV